MRSVAFFAAVLVGCSSPDICDQNVVLDIASIAGHHSGDLSTSGAFTCAGGGSGHGSSSGGSIWRETVTFDNCTENVDADTLTLTGTLMYGGDSNNNPINDHGNAEMFAIRGTVAGCGKVDETCTVQWAPKQDENDPSFYRSGTVCGRQFP